MNRQERQGRQEPTPQVDAIARQVVDAGLKVHRALGPGLLDLSTSSALPMSLGCGAFRGRDLLVEQSVIVEVKAVEALSRLQEAQLLTYLKLSGLQVGLLMNFNVPLFREGVRRLVT